MPDFSFEQKIISQKVAGVDEAGRGAYAGPLVVAAVILNPENPLSEVGDSKTFTERKRSELAKEIREREGSMKTTDEMFQLIITYVPYQVGDENISLENITP